MNCGKERVFLWLVKCEAPLWDGEALQESAAAEEIRAGLNHCCEELHGLLLLQKGFTPQSATLPGLVFNMIPTMCLTVGIHYSLQLQIKHSEICYIK